MKKLILSSTMVLAFLTLTKNASGQTQFYGVISNNTSCSVSIQVYDNGLNLLYSNTSSANSNTNINCTSGIPYYVDFTYNSCTIRVVCGNGVQNVQTTCGLCGNIDKYDVGCFTDPHCNLLYGSQITININP